MNWKPKKGVGKTLYVIDTWNYSFNSSSPYAAWSSNIYCPPITKYSDVMIITNGATNSSTFIVAKKRKNSITFKNNKENEYRTYKLKKINSIKEDKQGVVLMRGQNIVISNDKKEILNIFTALYKRKEKAARKTLDEYNSGMYDSIYTNSKWLEQKLNDQPKYVMESYKNFVKTLKKI
jgi:hypothetical protein